MVGAVDIVASAGESVEQIWTAFSSRSLFVFVWRAVSGRRSALIGSHASNGQSWRFGGVARALCATRRGRSRSVVVSVASGEGRASHVPVPVPVFESTLFVWKVGTIIVPICHCPGRFSVSV